MRRECQMNNLSMREGAGFKGNFSVFAKYQVVKNDWVEGIVATNIFPNQHKLVLQKVGYTTSETSHLLLISYRGRVAVWSQRPKNLDLLRKIVFT